MNSKFTGCPERPQRCPLAPVLLVIRPGVIQVAPHGSLSLLSTFPLPSMAEAHTADLPRHEFRRRPRRISTKFF